MIRTSAKTGDGVEEAFDRLVDLALARVGASWS
jgi:hypothetical protein